MRLAQVLLNSLFVILLVSLSVSARFLPTYQDNHQKIEVINIAHAGPALKTQEDDIFHLMGWEECNNRDEDCLKRRMISDAHLDYIYTQRHKPKP